MNGTMSVDERRADLAESKRAVAEVSDADLYSAALSDDAGEQAEVVEAQPEQVEHKADATGRLHAPDGKFAPKTADAAPTQQQPEQKPEQPENIGMRQLREAHERAERRAEAAERQSQEREAHWQRQLAEMQSRLPKAEPPPVPDIYDNPNGFLEHGVRQAVDPIKSEIGQLREFYSKRDAIRDHGEEAVKAAFDALDKAANGGDPEARAAVVRVKQSMDPFGDMVAWHKKQTVFQQIGSDPQAWFNKQLEDRLQDQTFQGKLLERIRGTASAPVQNGSAPKVQLPPSLNKVAAAARAAGDDDGDMSDASLFRHATR